VIRSGVDTLEHTFSGELSADIGEQLDRLKLLAQDTETPQPIWFEGREFFVQERSIRHYRWHLSNSWVLLHLRRGQFGPSMKCKLTARGLAEGGVEEYWDEVVAVAHSLGFAPLNLCRLDLAVDFQGWGPTFDEMRNVRCRSTHRPVIPNVDHPETFYFGKSPKMVRVYNKTVEIEKKHKEWWRTVWRSTGLYTEREPVWRCELELGSEILKELGCRSVGVALEQLGSIYAWGLEEVSLGAPNGDTNRSRWPEDDRWRLLRESFGDAQPLSRVREFAHLLDYHRAMQRHVGTATSLAATLGLSDYTQVAQVLFEGGQMYIDSRETTFARLVEIKRRRMSE
jgi:hypothetical protein